MNRFNIMFEAVEAGVSGDTEYSLWLEDEVISLREKVRRLTAEAARAAITAHPPERRATGAEPHVGQVAVNTPEESRWFGNLWLSRRCRRSETFRRSPAWRYRSRRANDAGGDPAPEGGRVRCAEQAAEGSLAS
jgi:hypothetical protein